MILVAAFTDRATPSDQRLVASCVVDRGDGSLLMVNNITRIDPIVKRRPTVRTLLVRVTLAAAAARARVAIACSAGAARIPEFHGRYARLRALR
jgi:hypothetical protein